ncbi:BA75_02531T0 [Komagataella pastoris]|uniref:3beta-hydroxysteroid 3-dehydrogenase n=1 Tax=Komagataella pastoris TaxID=4922 RepID=A0A1B2JAW9_PICPA|nr:BA75_02531T0 [Komagataella pastoris]
MSRKVAIVTGTNSNLGLSISYRLLETVTDPITLVVTSRTLPRVKEVIDTIKEFNSKLPYPRDLEFDYLLVDFTDIVSIISAAYDLNNSYDQINYLFINAAQGVYDGIDWIGATKQVLTNPVQSATFPTYKIQRVGVQSKDGLGLVFQANVFGPYYFIHRISRLLENANGARIVWISSIMSDSKYLSLEDMQLLRSDVSYEGSKRLVDLLHLATYKQLLKEGKIVQYVCHPGIFTSLSFMKYLNVFTYYGMLLLFYVVRFLGSPWHNITGYTAANAPLFCIKSDIQSDPQNLKYGSACSKKGAEYVKAQEIDDTGASDVLQYFEALRDGTDEKFKDQILETRKR